MINPSPASISACESLPSGAVRRAVSRNPNALRKPFQSRDPVLVREHRDDGLKIFDARRCDRGSARATHHPSSPPTVADKRNSRTPRMPWSYNVTVHVRRHDHPILSRATEAPREQCRLPGCWAARAADSVSINCRCRVAMLAYLTAARRTITSSTLGTTSCRRRWRPASPSPAPRRRRGLFVAFSEWPPLDESTPRSPPWRPVRVAEDGGAQSD